MIRRTSFISMLLASSALVFASCSKDESKNEPAPTPNGPSEDVEAPAGELDPAALAQQIGVEPGGFEPEANVGPDAVATGSGELAVRRVGEEEFTEASGEIELRAGDQLRTGAASSAVVTLADASVIELAEDTVVAIGDRGASADPAQSAAVLYGVARFSVSARADGEGPFLVFTPGGVVGTKGTTFGVGVSVSGSARIGVEEGEVELAGHNTLESPVALAAKQVAVVMPAGEVEEPAAFETDDWGEWRDSAEAEVAPEVVVVDHRKRLEVIEPELEQAYVSLAEIEAEVAAADTEAAEFEKAGNSAGYVDVAPKWGVSIEAGFLTSLRLQHLTYASMSHAYLAHAVHVRHPDKTETVYAEVKPKVASVVLHHKRFHGAVHLKVRPMRARYYRHHPRGRVNAPKVAVELPKFYRAKLPPIEPAKVRARARVKVYRPPVVVKINKKKKFVAAPIRVGWRAELKAEPRKPRGKAVGWYVAPPKRRASLVAGVKIKRKTERVFAVKAKTPRAKVKVRWGAAVRGPAAKVRGQGGVKIDHRAGVGVGAKGGVKVRDHRGAGVDVAPGGGVTVKGKAGAGVKVGPGGGVKVRDHRGGTGVKVKPNAAGGVTVKGKAGGVVKTGPAGGVKVKTPAGVKVKVKGGAKVKTPKVKKPAVKGGIKVKGKAGIKIKGGN